MVARSVATDCTTWTRTRFLQALTRFDERAAHDAWSETLERRDVLAAFEELLVPTLVDIGDAWHAGRLNEAQEHFASAFIRARLDSLARVARPLSGAPVVLLACAEGEQHELGLLMLNVLARFQGLATGSAAAAAIGSINRATNTVCSFMRILRTHGLRRCRR